MQKKVRFCSAGTAAILLMCGKFACPAPALAGQSKSAALPATGDLVQNGTHFLVRLDQEMNTGKDKVNKKFEVRTIEPLETSSGYVLPAGVKIVGHISRIEPGGLTGRARLWLTFDDIDTRRGTLPIVAEVSSVPGEYSVRQGVSKEGEIEARAGKGRRWLKPRPLARQWAARRESPPTTARLRQWAPRQAQQPVFWRPQELARKWICRKERSLNLC